MKRILCFFAVLLIANHNYSQGLRPNLKAGDLPVVIPPSPTVAALMKFEEVPVNNYTGIPDISVPLYDVKGLHGFTMGISMNYHPVVKKNDIASYTGLGWSLIAGGSISRTVRDIPDEYECGPGSCVN